MKKTDKFEWTEEAQAAFIHLKHVLSTPLILVAPAPKEPIYLYVAATNRVVSIVLMVERDEGKGHLVQRPIYYLSEVLSISKQRYPHYQKLAYGVFMSSRKLVHSFSRHPIIEVSSSAISDIRTNPDATGRVAKWVIELGPWDIKYAHPRAIKAQVLPDFTTEWIVVTQHTTACCSAQVFDIILTETPLRKYYISE